MRYVCVFLFSVALFVLPVLAEEVEEPLIVPEIEVVEPEEVPDQSEVPEGEEEEEVEVSDEDDDTGASVPSEDEGLEDSGDVEEPPVDVVPPEGETDGEQLPGDDVGSVPPELLPPVEGGEFLPDSSAMVDALSDELSGLADGVYNVWSVLDESEQFAPRAVPYEAPVAGYYMEVSTNLGDGALYVPMEYSHGSFSYDGGGAVISLSNSSINSLLVVGSTVYDVRFQLFSRPEYRRSSGSSWDWATLDIHDVTGGNVQVFESQSDVLPWVSDDMAAMIIILFLGAIVCKQFLIK